MTITRRLRHFLLYAAVLVAVGLVLSPLGIAQAATFTVDTLIDDGPVPALTACTAAAGDCSLRGAMTNAETLGGSHTIRFNVSGTISLLTALPVVDGSNITINGGGQTVTVERNPGAATDFSIFQVNGRYLEIISLTVFGGTGTGGYGGGVHNVDGILRIVNTTITSNAVNADGGGIYTENGSTTILSSVISGNSANNGGGGILLQDGTLDVDGTQIDSNTGLTFGGGIQVAGTADLAITDSSITNNDATLFGSAIYFDGNSATIENSTISSNAVAVAGGDISVVNGSVAFRHATIANNYSIGIDVSAAATVSLYSTIVANHNDFDITGTVTSLGYNLVEDVTGGTFVTTTGDITGVDPQLGPLANNGGNTLTHLLLPGSPAINAGDPAFAPPPSFDQRNFVRVAGGRIDIGAVETTTTTITNVTSPDADATYGLGATLTITVTFSDAVFVNGGTPTLTLANGGTATYVSGSGTDTLTFSYTVGAGQDTADLEYANTTALVLNGATIRNGSNQNADLTLPTPGASGSLGLNKNIVIDTTQPTVVSVLRASANPTSAATVDYTVTFSEAVSGVDVSDFTVTVTGGTLTGTSVASVSGGPTVYTVTVNTGTGEGTLRLDVLDDDTIVDAVNNPLNGGFITGEEYTVDRTAPTVVSSVRADADPTNAASVNFTVTFSEDVSGVDITDFTLTTTGTIAGASVTGVAGGPSVYTVTVNTGTGDGTIRLDVLDDDTIVDALANPLNGGFTTGEFYTIDRTGPTPTITSTATSPTNTSPIPVTVTFDEAVTGFTAADVTVTNGTVSNFVAVNATTYTFDVTPAAEGTVTVDVAAGVATDAVGNPNVAATQFVIVYDATAPTVTISSTATDPTNTSPIPVTVQFSEDVVGFTAADVVVGNGTVSNFVVVDANTYTFDVTPTVTSGTITVDVPAAVATDNAGNPNTAATQFTIVYDAAGPVPTITSTATNPTNTSPIPVTVTFNEDTIGFDAADVTVGNGTLSNFVVVDAQTYTFDITPAADGTVTVDIPAAVATDTLGNPNSAATQFSIVYDATDPVPTISTSAVDPTSTSPIPITITFSEAVTGFAAGDIVVGNGTVSNFVAVSATTYTFDLLPTANGTVTVDVPAAVATDLAGNPNVAAAQFSIVFDTDAPIPNISSTLTSPTNVSPIPITVEFSEDVFGFDATDLVIGNATLSNFVAVDANTYTFDLTPAADGPVTVSIGAGAAVDAANNGNTPSVFAIVYDSTGPVPTITSTATNPTNVSPIPVTVTFNEPTFGFDATDLVVGNGTVSNFVAVDTQTYTFDVTPAAEGTVTVDIPAAAGADQVGNPSAAATQFSIVYDATAPGVSISSTATSPTNLNPIPVTVTFTEAVTGFDVSDLTITNGSAANFAGGPTVYTFDLVPAADGTITVDIAAAVATDLAGNPNTAAAQFSIVFDGTPPTVTIGSPSPNPTNVSPIPVQVTFSEAVTGFDAADVVVGNGTISNFVAVDAQTYTFDVTPAADGTVTVDVPAAVAVDVANNPNTAAAQFSIVFDTTGPTVTITSTATNPTNLNPIPVTVTFSEAVTGFDVSDLTVSNGTVSNFTVVSPTTYTFDLTPVAEGTITVDIAAGVATDIATNPNTAAAQFSIVYDGTAPTTTISSTASNPTNVSPIPITVTFSEDVVGFDAADVDITNGTLSGFVAVNGSTYTFNITPLTEGLVTVDVVAGVATDPAGNPNTAAAQFTIVYDAAGPTVTISSTATNPTSVSPIPVTVTFSEAVTGFDVSDLVVSGATVTNFVAVNGSTYTFDLIPAGNGTITVDVPAGVAADAANNLNSPALQFSIVFADAVPTVTITSTATNPTNVSPIPVTVTFSENVTGFDAADVVVAGATLSNFVAVNGSTYTFDLTPTADGTITVDVPAGVAIDNVNNPNTAAPQFVIVYDGTAPVATVARAATQPDPAPTSPITFTVTFSEAVTGFDAADITLGGTASPSTVNVTAVSATEYTVSVSGMTGPGTVEVSVNANAATDAAGNPNAAAGPASVLFSPVGPVVTGITRLDANPADPNTTVRWSVTFSEAVTGVDINDFVLVQTDVIGSNIVSVTGSGNSYVVTATVGWSAGTVGLNLVDDDSITGNLSLPLGGPGAGNGNFTGEVYTVGALVPPPPRVEDIPVEKFLCSNVSVRTNASIEVGPGSTPNGGNVYCQILALNGTVNYSAQIGNPALLQNNIVQAVDVFGLLPGGFSITQFTAPVQVCLRGTGGIFFLNAEGAGQRQLSQLAAYTQGIYTCALIPNAGTVVLIAGAAAPPAQAVAPNVAATPLTDCRVTITNTVRLRSTPDTTSSSNIVTSLPFGLELVATEALPGWYRVIYLDGQGWVSSQFVNTIGQCSP